jgi:Fic family protein
MAMADLVARYRTALDQHLADPLVLVPLAVLDFLCIHPFPDGNGRMARLLTLQLLYHFDCDVGRYISLLFRVMKAKGLHEGCIEQMRRLAFDHLAQGATGRVDESGFIRLDDLELRADVQAETLALWDKVTTENLAELSDIAGFRRDFSQLFGFDVEGVDYESAVETDTRLA